MGVRYRPGAQNIADTLSKLSMARPSVTDDAKTYVRFIAKNAVPNAVTIQQVEKASESDQEVAVLRKCITTNSEWETVDLSYRSVQQELCVPSKLVI